MSIAFSLPLPNEGRGKWKAKLKYKSTLKNERSGDGRLWKRLSCLVLNDIDSAKLII